MRHLPRNRLVLALIVGFHLFAILVWPQKRSAQSPAPLRLVSILLLPAAQPVPRDKSPSSPTSTQRQNQVVKEVAIVLPTSPKPTESLSSKVLPASSSDTPQAAITLDTTSIARPNKEGETSEANTETRSDSKFDIELAKQQARRVAKEIGTREFKALTEANTPWTRFRNELNAAHVEPATGVHWESYTSPDGTIIYREHVGNQIVCHRSGNVSRNDIGSTGGANSAGYVSCPSHVEWKGES